MFLHRLAEESRAKAFEEKSGTIKSHHIKAVSKVTIAWVDQLHWGALKSNLGASLTHATLPHLFCSCLNNYSLYTHESSVSRFG